MKPKKLKNVLMAAIIAVSTVSLTGCSLVKDITGNHAEEESSEETDTETEESESESITETADNEEWVPNLDIMPKEPEPETITETQTDDTCNCPSLCYADSIYSTCPVCSRDFHKCKVLPEEDPLDEFALPEGQTETASIIAFGSNFYNTAVMNGTDKSYDYNYIYENIKDVISNYDVRIITQEGPFTNNPGNYSGSSPYLLPPSIATALTNAGFNVISSATDHAFDNGRDGIVDTLNAWESYGDSALVAGIYASDESYDNICMADVNGIRIAFLSYTSGLNGMTLTNDEKKSVKTLYDENEVADEIKKASSTADFVVVIPHWGTDTSAEHTKNQEKWAEVFVNNGADLIIGTGPDCMQDVDLYHNNDGEIVPCYYSLGNFVSAKKDPSEVLSGAAVITVTKTGKETTLEKYDMIPVSLHVSKKGDYFKSYLLDEYPEDTIKWHNLIQNGKDLSLQGMKDQFNETFHVEDLTSYMQTQQEPQGLKPVQSAHVQGSPETETNITENRTVSESSGNSPFGSGISGTQPVTEQQ